MILQRRGKFMETVGRITAKSSRAAAPALYLPLEYAVPCSEY